MTAPLNWLPALLNFEEHDGDWARYLDAVFACFRDGFIDDTPQWTGLKVGHRARPYFDGMPAGFWHLITAGAIEDERLPDIRRCERIRWPRAMIEAPTKIRVWPEIRYGRNRIALAPEDFSYVVVLEPRRRYVMLITAHLVEKNHQRRKHEKAWAEAQKKTPPS